MHVSAGTFRAAVAEDDILKACAAKGYPPAIGHLQDFDACNACDRWLRYVSRDGRRQDAAHAFVHPKLRSGQFPQPHVLVETKALRVLFDGNRACGLECVPNLDFYPGKDASSIAIRAEKMVILSSGALGTPLVLERSGIGSLEVLKKAGITALVDLPSVGQHLQGPPSYALQLPDSAAGAPDARRFDDWQGDA